MTDASSIADCNGACSSKGPTDLSGDCSGVRKPQIAKALKFGAGFIALCAICCAVPAALIALGIIGVAAGAYLSAGATVALIVLAVSGLGYLAMIYLKKKL